MIRLLKTSNPNHAIITKRLQKLALFDLDQKYIEKHIYSLTVTPGPTLKPKQSEVMIPSLIDRFCKGRKSRNYPDPTRCDGFIACSNGIAYKMDCPAHLWYDFKTDRCDYPANVKCKCK